VSIYKRKGSPYWYYDFVMRGKRVRGCTKQSKKQLANIVESELVSKARNEGVEALLMSSPKLEEFSADFLKWVEETHSIKEKTKKHYKNGWRMLSTTSLAGMKMDAIRNGDCETISFPGSNHNANQALTTLRRMFGKAVEKGQLNRAPKIKLRAVEGRNVAMSIEHADLIASKMDPQSDAKDALRILRGTGMRPMEAFSMRWEFWNRGHAYYQNPRGKSKSSRRPVPLLGDSTLVLERRRLEQGSPAEGWVFPSPRSKTGHINSIKTAFKRARKLAGLPSSMVLYTARHGMGTDLGAVVSLKEVMEVLGHTQTKTALGYQHPDVMGLQAKLAAAKTNGRVM
jgi:integrase